MRSKFVNESQTRIYAYKVAVHRVVCGLWLWYFLIILTIFVGQYIVIALWNVCLGWVGITNSVISDQIAPWEARLLELTLFDQAYPVLQIASVQAQIMGTFFPNMDRVEN